MGANGANGASRANGANGQLRNTKFKAPRGKIARKAYEETLGVLLAKERVWEMKAAQFGRLSAKDRFSTLATLPGKEGYTDTDRKRIYEKALQLYDQNELIRPAVNTIASAVFSNGSPDVRGTRFDLVDLARKIIDFNALNFVDLAREGELAGDAFLWFKPNNKLTEIRSLDAGGMRSILEKDNIRNVSGYALARGADTPQTFSPAEIQHLKFNSTTTSQYGRSSLRHVFYWTDVLDSLFEKNWLRGAQYYGNPLIAIIGVPGPYQATIKTQIEAEIQRAGKSWVLPPDTDVKVPDFSLGFPIGEIVGWVFRMISIALEIPITLFGSADAASRGSAFFANPRFVLSIKPKREVWRLGLREFFIKIFKATGKLGADETLSVKEFDFGFLPVFDRDYTDLADIVGIYRDRKLISKQSSRELIGLDHSDEEERMELEPQEEPVAPGEPADGQIPSQTPPTNPVRQLKSSAKAEMERLGEEIEDLDTRLKELENSRNT